MAIVHVLSPPPVAPAGKTPVKRTSIGSVPSNQSSQDIYTIPSESTLVIQHIHGGVELSVAGGRVELLYRTSGSVDEIVNVGYASGNNFRLDLNERFVGNGERVLIMKQINQGGGPLHMFSRWTGYLE